MHFTYTSANRAHLSQGDVIRRTEAIDKILAEVHPHYLHKKNTYFQVLTQSCDLVRRQGSECKARYISLAAIRSLSDAYERELSKYQIGPYPGLPPILEEKGRSILDQFLQRLLNNNEPNYFYLHKEPSSDFPDNSCTFLRLSVAVKSLNHYETLLDGRVLELEESFQAKLGWLVGQLYSRVGTQDWPQKSLNEQIKEIHDKEAVTVDLRMKRRLVLEIEKEIQKSGEASLEALGINKLLKRIPAQKEEVLQRIGELLDESILIRKLRHEGHVDDAQLRKLLNLLRADQRLTTLLR